MKTKYFTLLATVLVVAGLFASTVPLSAHHAFTSEFDHERIVTVAGVVTKVDWINPHAYIYVDVEGEGGSLESWAIETFPPGALRRRGLERDMLEVGATVTIHGYGARDVSKSVAWAQRMQFADGRTIIFSRDANDTGDN